MELVAGRGFYTISSRQHRIKVGEGIPGYAALEHEIVFIPDLTRPGPALRIPEKSTHDEFVSMFAVPLVAKGQLYGVLELYYSKSINDDPEWTGFLETIARQVAVAIDRMQLFNQLQQSLIEQQVAQDETIEGWPRLLVMRGLEPEGHVQRVAGLTLKLASLMENEDKKLASIYIRNASS